MELTVCLPCSSGSISRLRQNISRDFSLADRTLPSRPDPAWQKMAPLSYYPILLYPLSYLMVLYPLNYPMLLYATIFHSVLSTELSHCPTIPYPPSYPVFPKCYSNRAIPLSHSALPTALFHYPK